jgi:zinc protease
MFEGSAHHDGGYFHPLQEAGALLNGSTSTDRTNYWEVVPTNALELALWMESDRMGHLLPALTEAKFDNQRDVVLNERRQNYENRPYGLAVMAMVAALYPPDHPYHWLTIGVGRRPAREHARRGPRVLHALLPSGQRVAGSGRRHRQTRGPRARGNLLRRDPGRPRRLRPRAPASLPADARLLLEDRVELPRLYLAWHSPAMFAPGDADLDLAADILASGKTSRLYQALVYGPSRDRGGGVPEFPRGEQLLPGDRHRRARAHPRRDRVGDGRGVEAVCERGTDRRGARPRLAQAEAQFVYRLQTVGGFGGKSDQLNAYHVYLGDPGYFRQDLDRYRTATRETVRRAVADWLVSQPRVTLSVVPRGDHRVAAPGAAPVVVQ